VAVGAEQDCGWFTRIGRRLDSDSCFAAQVGQAVRFVLPIIAVGFALLTYKFATLGANDGTEGLTAGTRSAFVDTAIDTCVKQSDKNFSAETIAQYCRCYANGMADRVSINELKYIHNMKQEQAQAALQPKIDAADNACRDRLTP
jgi:hypothetical protein